MSALAILYQLTRLIEEPSQVRMAIHGGMEQTSFVMMLNGFCVACGIQLCQP
jgi:hypothetical protein